MYTIQEIIYKYSLPITRGNQSVLKFLRQYYENFITDIQEIKSSHTPEDFPDSIYDCILTKVVPVIKDECSTIVEILEYEQRNAQLEKRKKFNELMNTLFEKNALRINFLRKGKLLSRVRCGINLTERKDLFHIANDERQYASSQRFSIPGNPSLYLSTCSHIAFSVGEMVELSWCESGMPKKYYASLYEVQKELALIHFAKTGKVYLWEYKNAKNEKEKNDRLEALVQYLYTFPLRAVCFIEAENKCSQKNIHYYEEYVIPQLLMEWVQKSSFFDGITYQSVALTPIMRNDDAYNVVFPVRVIDPEDGLDLKLKKYFKLSPPKEIDFIKTLKIVEDEIYKVNEYAKSLEEKLRMSFTSSNHPCYCLLSVCRSLEQIYENLKNENEKSIRNDFLYLNTLRRESALLYKSMENAGFSDEWVKQFQYTCCTELTAEDYKIILQGFHTVSLVFLKLESVLRINNQLDEYVFERSEFDFV